jgi:hypothetical protein
MTQTWTLGVARTDLARTTLVEHELPELADGEARLRVDRVGLTANNVTYAVLGDAPWRYWEFFPPARHGLDDEWGVVPLWGFADVVESTVDGLAEGDRLYGYYPSAGHLVVRPGRADARGFRDASEHRAALPGTYNGYVKTTGDPAYEPDQEDLLILYRPLYYTSFMLADQVADNDFYGAEAVVLSSASSKTSYGTAFLLHGQGPRVVGLTSPGNVDFTRGLGCYDEVISYADLASLDPDGPRSTSTWPGTRRCGPESARAWGTASCATSRSASPTRNRTRWPRPAVFFAPDQIRKRSQDWGRDGLDQRFGEAWRRFATTVADWVDVQERSGPTALRETWTEVHGGHTPPRIGHVIAL